MLKDVESTNKKAGREIFRLFISSYELEKIRNESSEHRQEKY